jgi:hypothetical protein
MRRSGAKAKQANFALVGDENTLLDAGTELVLGDGRLLTFDERPYVA